MTESNSESECSSPVEATPPASGGQRSAILNGLSAGFEGYLSPSDDDYRAVLTSGLVVLDTNVLLNLYRFDEEARTDLLAIFARLRDNVWIPHQTLEEFWRNREQTILSRRNSRRDAVNSLTRPVRALEDAVATWARSVGLSDTRRAELRGLIQKTHDTLRNAMEGPQGSDPLAYARDTNRDPVFASLRPLFAGRVGHALQAEDLTRALAEAERRATANIPPGYLDRDKPDNRGPGDYLVWEQTLLEATRRAADVLIVTSDLKEDWWRKVNGTSVGPRIELVSELRDRAGTRLFMLQPQQLLAIAGRLFDVTVRPDSESQIARTALGTSGEGSTHADRVRLYLVAALDQALPKDRRVNTDASVGEVTWDVSVTVDGMLAAVVWIYDPVKPFNDLATNSVLSTAAAMITPIQRLAKADRTPWIACVVDLASLTSRIRSEQDPWERSRESDGALFDKALAAFEPHVGQLRDLGFDHIEVLASEDRNGAGEASPGVSCG